MELVLMIQFNFYLLFNVMIQEPNAIDKEKILQFSL